MRKAGLLLFQILLVSSVYAQHTEYSLHLNSGLFSFGGESTTSNTFIIEKRTLNDAYTNNPYGNNKALSYGLSVQVQRITQGNFLFGIQGGVEVLRSNVNITHVSERDNSGNLTPASGDTFFRHRSINIYPNLGYRFNLSGIDFDITAGPEIGFILNSKEIGEATMENGATVKTNHPRNKPGNDFRLRSSLTIHYKAWGFSTGYSLGISNYTSGAVGGTPQVFSRFIRLGIAYKIFE